MCYNDILEDVLCSNATGQSEISDSTASQKETATSAHGTAGPFKVLFVDDEENVLRSLQRLFVESGHEIYTAPSGEEGLEVVKNHQFAVVVSDQRMPKMSGAEFLEQVRQISPDTVRIVLTGYADINSAIDAINKGGAYRYISKPWNNDDIVLTVQSAVERYKLVAENRYLTELTKQQNEELQKWSEELQMYVQEQTIDLTYKTKDLTDMNSRLTGNFSGLIVTMSNLIELRDQSVANHSNNVTAISKAIAKELGVNEADMEHIAIAAQLHDIGKIGIPDVVLMKDIETLSPSEIQQYRKHPIRGQAAIDSNEMLREAGVLIRHHHEFLNGKGFPDGIKGDQIPLGSRIIGIVDKYDRLLTYHEQDQALEELRPLLRTQFDSQLYTVLTGVVNKMAQELASMKRTVERELRPYDLVSGMVVSREVRSGTGLLLVSTGTVLNSHQITSITRYYNVDPPESGVFVWIEKG